MAKMSSYIHIAYFAEHAIYTNRADKKGKIDWINIKRKCRDKFNKNKTNSQ